MHPPLCTGQPWGTDPWWMISAQAFNKNASLLACACSNTTPAHPSSDFKYKDYSPKVSAQQVGAQLTLSGHQFA